MDDIGEGQACSRCGTAALVLHNGLLVCEACGTQAEVLYMSMRVLLNPCGQVHTAIDKASCLQDFVEETAEFQVGVDDTTRRRRLRVNRRQAIVQGEAEAPVPVREAIKCYCKCMQVMLQAGLMHSSLYDTDISIVAHHMTINAGTA